MALNNMKLEPRREWTEQIFGLLVLIIYLCTTWVLSGHMTTPGHDPHWLIFIGLSLILWLLVVAALFIPYCAWYLAHGVGELVCSVLKSLHLDPRPKNRPYGRN